ncbi:hypothetical protein HMPREF1982_03973 [Clostridiales bacterium oral taxon 876 str. F0540]|nr:hypothetical protein HMPREF1982_03973 [Clostridiales bacterium oral taxon 876 str. F0540]
MFKKKYILITSVIIAFLSVAFILSFTWGVKRFTHAQDKYNKGNSLSADNSDKYTSSNIKAEDTIKANTKITLKIEYSKSGDTDSKQLNAADYVGKTKSDLEKEGYTVESMTSSSVSLYKKIESYAPNKYVLGVQGECFVIYRTDANGNLYIEDESKDITNVKVPTKGEYNLLVKGSKYFQFNTREEVEEKLGEYSS